MQPQGPIIKHITEENSQFGPSHIYIYIYLRAYIMADPVIFICQNIGMH